MTQRQMPFTKEEIRRLKEIGPTTRTVDLLPLFPGRTYSYIQHWLDRLRVRRPIKQRRLALRSRFIELYDAGHSDRSIASLVGTCDDTVRHHRRKLGLQPNYIGSKKVKHEMRNGS